MCVPRGIHGSHVRSGRGRMRFSTVSRRRNVSRSPPLTRSHDLKTKTLLYRPNNRWVFSCCSCVDKVGTFVCQCLPGLTGRTCTRDLDECISQPCLNGGRCEDKVCIDLQRPSSSGDYCSNILPVVSDERAY